MYHSNVECDIDAKKVQVKGSDLKSDLLLEKLQKWGKAAGKDVELVSEK